MPAPAGLENERLLELFFSQSLDGFVFMMLDGPVAWGDHADKGEVMDFVFDHLRMTKMNDAVITQFGASSADNLLGMTPAQFFAHDLASAKRRWHDCFDAGHMHTETDERRLDGIPMRVKGDYMVIQGRLDADLFQGRGDQRRAVPASGQCRRCDAPAARHRLHLRQPGRGRLGGSR